MNEPHGLGPLERSFEVFFARVRAEERAPSDLWTGVVSRLNEVEAGPTAPRRRIGRRAVLRFAAAASIVAVAMVGVFLVTVRGDGPSSSTVSAEEVLRRAVVTAAAPEAGGIARLTLTLEIESFATGDWGGDEPSFEARMQSWYQAPNHQRIEGEYLWREFDGGTTASSIITVWDGDAVWRHTVDEQRVVVQNQDVTSDTFLQGLLWGGSVPNVSHELATACRTPQIVDDGEVVGRATYVLELSRPRCGLVFPGGDGKQRIWVDRETGLVLRSEWYAADGMLASVRRVTAIAVDAEIDDRRFDFILPPGVALDDRRGDASYFYLTGLSMPEEPPSISIGEAREAATFELQVPTFVPAGFSLESVQQYWGGEMARELRSHADWVLLRYVDEGGNWLQIAQGYGGPLSGLMVAAPADARQGSVSVGGVDVLWVDGSPAVWGWGPGAMLTMSWQVNRDGTAREYVAGGDVQSGSPRSMSLATNVLSLDELVAVAESLE